ncbi:TfoX/Sxy family protein [Krasilnikoviella flava]|uniref:Transcriptional regulator of competence genes, TfoX/Sxy family n=1 Tax=Krasilnikoviella flava TaxID=526729 RepID=A0A1T5L0L2_9MICO|nr:TfoX/Sxy family protein [Krasilnikoviella flava]SKC68938.1 Transcriptional regulator of competence genes, TfoX/Sxy family [Krasilnikoviella flava]
MAYDEELAARVRDTVAGLADFTEQRMFGGLAFMVHTHMAVGITRDELMVHVGTDDEAALADGAHELRMGDRVMRGMVGVPASVTADEDALRGWVARGVDLALARPPKPPRR